MSISPSFAVSKPFNTISHDDTIYREILNKPDTGNPQPFFNNLTDKQRKKEKKTRKSVSKVQVSHEEPKKEDKPIRKGSFLGEKEKPKAEEEEEEESPEFTPDPRAFIPNDELVLPSQCYHSLLLQDCEITFFDGEKCVAVLYDSPFDRDKHWETVLQQSGGVSRRIDTIHKLKFLSSLADIYQKQISESKFLMLRWIADNCKH